MGDLHFEVTTLAFELFDNATNISTASEKTVIDLVKITFILIQYNLIHNEILVDPLY